MLSKSKHTCIIIDNKITAINRICEGIQKHFDNIDILSAVQDLGQAVELIMDRNPDFIFLDIDIPRLNEYELLQKANGPKFETLFTTSNKNTAVHAFEFSALAYLTKPIEDDLFVAAVNKCLTKITERNNLELLTSFFQDRKGRTNLDTIALPSVSGFLIRNINDIVHIESESRYAVFNFIDGTKYVSSYNIGKYKSILKNGNFISTHKAHLVNKQHIREYSNSGFIVLSNSRRIPVAKSLRSTLISKVKFH